jgi:hypothetical protein
VAKMDWMTKLVPADGGDAGIAIVDARPLKRIAQDIWPARPCPGKRRWSARKNPRSAHPLVSDW